MSSCTILVDYALGRKDCLEFKDLLDDHFNKNSDFEICDSSDTLDFYQLTSFWDKVNNYAIFLVDQVDSNVEIDDLKQIAQFIVQYVESGHGTPTSFISTLETLHNLLIPLDENLAGAKAFKLLVARACEHVWIKGIESAELLIPQLIPFLLCNALGSSKDVDIKRIYAVRSAIMLLDFKDPTIESIRDLLMQCFLHAGFYRSAEGRRLLSFVFTLDEELHSGISTSLRQLIASQIIGNSDYKIALSQLPVYVGDVLLRAWKDISAACSVDYGVKSKRPIESTDAEKRYEALLGSFEVKIMQDLLTDSVLAGDKKYFRVLFGVFQHFNNDKNARGVDNMLVRVYSPIIWRSLKCNNSQVRAQATTLFCSAFPLRPSNITAAEDDDIMQKHFTMFSSILKDADHTVRSAGVNGICKVLADFWEPIPVGISSVILTYMINTLSHDSSSTNVRLCVIQGLQLLLDCPLALSCLKTVLPYLSNSLHDIADCVRLEFVNLLIKVRDIRGMHFYDIASVDQLLQRLVIDSNKPVICNALTELLVTNIYPQIQEGDGSLGATQMNRCMRILQQDLRSALSFYSNMHNFVPLGSTTKFAVNLFIQISSGFENLSAGIRDLIGKCRGKKFDSQTTSQIMSSFNLPVGLLQVLLALLISVKGKLCELNDKDSNDAVLLQFRKFYNFSSLVSMLLSTRKLMDLTMNNMTVGTKEYVEVAINWATLWSLQLQLFAVACSIQSSILDVLKPKPVAVKPQRGKKASKEPAVEPLSEWHLQVVPNILSTTALFVQFFTENSEANTSLIMFELCSSSVEALCCLKAQDDLLMGILFSFSDRNSDTAVRIPSLLAMQLLEHLLEDLSIEFIASEESKVVERLPGKDFFRSSLINYGYPQFKEHSRLIRVGIQKARLSDDIASSFHSADTLLTAIFESCGSMMEQNIADAFNRKLFGRGQVLFFSHCLQSAKVLSDIDRVEKAIKIGFSELNRILKLIATDATFCVDTLLAGIGLICDFIVAGGLVEIKKHSITVLSTIQNIIFRNLKDIVQGLSKVNLRGISNSAREALQVHLKRTCFVFGSGENSDLFGEKKDETRLQITEIVALATDYLMHTISFERNGDDQQTVRTLSETVVNIYKLDKNMAKYVCERGLRQLDKENTGNWEITSREQLEDIIAKEPVPSAAILREIMQ